MTLRECNEIVKKVFSTSLSVILAVFCWFVFWDRGGFQSLSLATIATVAFISEMIFLSHRHVKLLKLEIETIKRTEGR